MSKNPNRLWIVALLLGWAFDFLFWKKPTGINFAIYAVLCLLGGLLLLLAEGIRPGQRSLWLLAPLIFFSIISFIRREPLTAFLGYSLTLFALSVFALTYLGGRWIHYSLSDYFSKYLDLVGSMVGRPFSFNREVRKAQPEEDAKKKPLPIWPVLRGLLIALPVVAVFAALLASADVVFSQKLEGVLQLLRLENLAEYIFRLVYILVGAYAIAGIILHAASRSGDEKLLGQDKPLVSPFLGFTESSIVLGSLTILFLSFVIIQFQYFFGGHANIRIDGFTYSEYARRGFGELVTVAFFTLLLLLGLGAVTRREREPQRRVFSGFGIGLVALVLVMLVSAYQRLVLYETAYGFSRLRTYTHVVLYWIALLLVATILLEILRRERVFAFAAVIAALGFAVSLSLLNVDAFIVKQNIQRELQGSVQVKDDVGRAGLDSQYFLALSDDAVPAMVAAYQVPSLPAALKEKIGAALACVRYARSRGDQKLPWQSFHLSRYYADRALAEVDQALSEYKIETDRGPVVIGVQGGQYPCWGSYD